MMSSAALRLDDPCDDADPSASRWITEDAFADRVLYARGVVALVVGSPALRSTRDVAARVAAATPRFPCVSAYRVDVEAEPGLNTLLRVAVLPTVVLYRGGIEIGRLEGMRSPMVYELAIETAVNAPAGV